MFCLNLCEILNSSMCSIFEKWLQFEDTLPKGKEVIKRIYVGSSFCSQYFLMIDVWDQLIKFCSEHSLYITLVIPIFSEKHLEDGKKAIKKIIIEGNGIIDEVTVNDFGMLNYIRSEYDISINFGRLFFKDQRDRRFPLYMETLYKPSWLSIKEEWMPCNPVGIELDPTNAVIDLSEAENLSISVGMHIPFCYMTTGNICKFASVHHSLEKKFRPNLNCKGECRHILETYYDSERQERGSLIRLGRTIYFLQSEIEIKGRKVDRYIYWAVKELADWKKVKK